MRKDKQTIYDNTPHLILSPNAGARYEGGTGQKLASSLRGNINIVIMYTADTYLAAGGCTLCQVYFERISELSIAQD